MKKIILAVFLVFLFAGTAPASGVNVKVNGEQINFSDLKPFIDSERTYIPLRSVTEALGADIDWDGEKAVIEKGETNIEMAPGNRKPEVNGNKKELDAPAKLKDGRMAVPLRFIGETMDAGVEWREKTNTVIIQESDSRAGEKDHKTINGYDVPKNSNLSVYEKDDVYGYDEEETEHDLDLQINLYKKCPFSGEKYDMEPQYKELYSIIKSKHGEDAAEKLVKSVKDGKSGCNIDCYAAAIGHSKTDIGITIWKLN